MSKRWPVYLHAVLGLGVLIAFVVTTDLSASETATWVLLLLVPSLLDLKLMNGMTVDIGLTFVPLAMLAMDPVSSSTLLIATRLLGTAGSTLLNDGDISWFPSLRRTVVTVISLAVLSVLSSNGLGAVVAISILVFIIDYALQRAYLRVKRRQTQAPLAHAVAVVEETVGAAQLSLAILGVLVFPGMGWWALLVVSVMLLAMRQSASMYLQMRIAYDTIVRTLVRAVQARSVPAGSVAEDASGLLVDCSVSAARSLGTRRRDLSSVFYAATFCSLRSGSSVSEYRSFVESRVLGKVRFLHGANRLLLLVEGLDLPSHPDFNRHELRLAYLLDVSTACFAGQDPSCAAPHLAECLGKDDVLVVQEAVLAAARQARPATA